MQRKKQNKRSLPIDIKCKGWSKGFDSTKTTEKINIFMFPGYYTEKLLNGLTPLEVFSSEAVTLIK